MRLLYDTTHEPVKIGDIIALDDGGVVKVTYFREPHKPSSSGKISIKYVNTERTAEYYVSVIGATWVDREDR